MGSGIPVSSRLPAAAEAPRRSNLGVARALLCRVYVVCWAVSESCHSTQCRVAEEGVNRARSSVEVNALPKQNKDSTRTSCLKPASRRCVSCRCTCREVCGMLFLDPM